MCSGRQRGTQRRGRPDRRGFHHCFRSRLPDGWFGLLRFRRNRFHGSRRFRNSARLLDFRLRYRGVRIRTASVGAAVVIVAVLLPLMRRTAHMTPDHVGDVVV